MNKQSSLSRFIASRLAVNRKKDSWSKPVVQIATAGVAIGMALIVVATSVVHGFQNEVKELVVGFSSDIQVLNGDWSDQKIKREEGIENQLRALPSVQSVHPFYTAPGIVESSSGIKGVVLKGMNEETSNGMLEKFLVQGSLPSGSSQDTAILSMELATRLELQVNDVLTVYLIGGPQGIRPRTMTLGGIYRTGLLEYDEEFMFVPASAIQSTSGWGMELQVRLDEQTVEARAYGGNRTPQIKWLTQESDGTERLLGWSGQGQHDLLNVDASCLLAVAESRDPEFNALSDTAWVRKTAGQWELQQSGGAWKKAASGYEVYVQQDADLWTAESAVYTLLPLGWITETVLQQAPEMFTWLGMLDLNVEIIIGLMVLISIINMTSALLILILERRPMVGMLKALGMSDAEVLSIFLWQAIRILGRGFWLGNALGFLAVYIQKSTGWIGLNPEAYYLSEVPVQIDFGFLLLVETLVFCLCVAMMLIPALASTRIRPADALRMTG